MTTTPPSSPSGKNFMHGLKIYEPPEDVEVDAKSAQQDNMPVAPVHAQQGWFTQNVWSLFATKQVPKGLVGIYEKDGEFYDGTDRKRTPEELDQIANDDLFGKGRS